MTDYDKLEEQRQMARSNYYAQLAMMGYDSGGNPLDDVVRIVRCPSCKYHVDVDGYHTCKKLKMLCPDDAEFFCKYGKRRENE